MIQGLRCNCHRPSSATQPSTMSCHARSSFAIPSHKQHEGAWQELQRINRTPSYGILARTPRPAGARPGVRTRTVAGFGAKHSKPNCPLACGVPSADKTSQPPADAGYICKSLDLQNCRTVFMDARCRHIYLPYTVLGAHECMLCTHI